ncbi:uncharacterized protein erich1 [Aulostomus maculatus]
MTHRNEVFQSKVIQKLYPASPKSEKDPSPPCIPENVAQKKLVKRKAAKGDAGMTGSAANLGRRLYTVLPPPADYNADSVKSVTLFQQDNINSAEDPAEVSVQECSDQDEEAEEQKRRKRRRKRKMKRTSHGDSGENGTVALRESSSGQSGAHVDEGRERISSNKKRKLKKKRHKEKLLSMGVRARASALEFTYQRDGDERRAAEVSDFLRTTMDIYVSDSSMQAEKLAHLPETLDDLLSDISSRSRPTSLLEQLYSLKALVQQKETDGLAKALEELGSSTHMLAEEAAAVVSLFQYWITDILPMQGDKKTELSITHPRD